MVKVGIYKIENLINHKIYIGQSVNIDKRWREHKKNFLDEEDSSYNTHLYKSMRKYGIENFDFSIVELCLQEELNEKERFWVSYYDSFFNGYNLTFGGDSAGRGKNKEKIIGILKDLEETTLTHEQIAQKWELSSEMVQGINTGRYWYHDREYPIRKQYRRPKTFCIDCQKEITFGSTRCLECERVHRIVPLEQMPISREELKDLIRKKSFVEIGRMFQISDNAIRKWCAKFNLPRTKKEIKQMTEEQWKNI